MKLTPEGLQLLLDGEVGGGWKYYEKFCLHPVVPGGKDTNSGITLGIGYDCGAQSTGTFLTEWEDFLSQADLARLLTVVGLRGAEAKRWLPILKDITIPWDAALEQFERYSVPRYWAATQQAFPGVTEAPPCVQEALLSLVFNRGPSMAGARRIEMRFIRIAVAAGQWSQIPVELREMKRLWPDTKGLQNRREAEARHIEIGLAKSNSPQSAQSAQS